ncbi:MAG: SusD/RagB family nutrient-binding outer membrane lipoprotein [Bacteroidota bacterium]
MKFVYKIALSLILVFSLSSCEDFIGGDINQDPNNPTAVPITGQMPAFQIAIADVYGGAFSRFSCMLSQQVEGVARQWQSFNQYTGLTPNRFDAAWQNVYENILNEIKIAKVSATEGGLNHYLGVLEVMEAFTLMTATDVWDDMPYSDGLQGIAAVNPTYDTQAQIYDVINNNLDNALRLFGGAPGPLVPGGEDVFYGGNIGSWTRAAHALKARSFMKFGNYAGAASEAAQGFVDASENMSFQYPDANNAGQWFRFNRDRTGDIEFHPTMRAIMTGLNDADRLGVMDNEFVTTHPYMVPNFLQEMITYREMQFIIAEADVRAAAGGTQAGYDAYLEGIKASFTRLGLGDAEYDAYIANPDVGVGTGNLTLETVMIQKYIAMFLQPETYSDFRRTGIPALTPVSGTAVPVRWHYSSDEYLFNSNSPTEAEVNIFTNKVGWNR